MIPHLGLLTTGIKLKSAILATAMVISSPHISNIDTIPSQTRQPQRAVTAAGATAGIGVTADAALWRYLRAGLNYVEASGREVPVDFIHEGGVAYGPLALTRIAVKDVLLHCRSMTGRTVDEVLGDRLLYEECALRYADLLLRHYLKIDTDTLSRREIFEILQKAWFLGPTIYKKGGSLPLSRRRHSAEYLRIARVDQ